MKENRNSPSILERWKAWLNESVLGLTRIQWLRGFYLVWIIFLLIFMLYTDLTLKHINDKLAVLSNSLSSEESEDRVRTSDQPLAGASKYRYYFDSIETEYEAEERPKKKKVKLKDLRKTPVKETVEPKQRENVEPEEVEEAITYAFDKTGYVSCARLNVRSEPNTDSKVYQLFYQNTKLHYSVYNKKWAIISYGDDVAYVSRDYISKKKIEYPYVEKDAWQDRRKSYMDYRCITSTGSKQYYLQQTFAYTEDNGVRAINGRYMVALGSFYTHKIGQYVDLVLQNGVVIPAIIGDAKSDHHTINNHSLGLDGGVAEFIVDTPALSTKVKQMGDVSYSLTGWLSNVASVRIYDYNILD